jgi:hypothetical protein
MLSCTLLDNFLNEELRVCPQSFPQWQHGNWLVAWEELCCCPLQLRLCLVVVVGSVGPGVSVASCT